MDECLLTATRRVDAVLREAAMAWEMPDSTDEQVESRVALRGQEASFRLSI